MTGELERFVRERVTTDRNSLLDIPSTAMFCLAMRRDVYNRLGPLDERFGVVFEDDDYALRAHQTGYRVVCTEDVFRHQLGQASFGKLIPVGSTARCSKLTERALRRSGACCWEPHQQRKSLEYLHLSERIGAVVPSLVAARMPPVAIISRGDDDLLDLAAARLARSG